MRPTFLTILCCLPLLAAACCPDRDNNNSSARISQDPGEYRPSAPANLGVAGPVNGVWRVVSSQLLADDRTRNPDLSQGWLSGGELLEFRDGIVLERVPDDDDDPYTNDPITNGQPGPGVVAEFACNQREGALTLYGFGGTFTDSLGYTEARVCAIFGTTGIDTATAIVVDEFITDIPEAETDRFMVYEVLLVLEAAVAGNSLLEGDGSGR